MAIHRWLPLVLILALIGGLVWMMRSALDQSFETPRDGDSWAVDGLEPQLPKPPVRVFPANASVVDLVLALLEPGRIVAIPEQADDWSLLVDRPEEFRSKPRFSRYVAETALSFDPDLVVASQFNNLDTNDRLRERGFPVLRLRMRNNMQDVYGTLHYLGGLFEVSARAEKVVADLKGREASLRERTAHRPKIRALYYSNHGGGGWTFGRHSTVDCVFELAGLENLGAQSGQDGSHPISFEELLTLDPDLLILSGGGEGDAGPTRALVMRESALSVLTARRKGALISAPPHLIQSSSQGMLAAAEWLVTAIDAHLKEGEGR